MAAIRANGSNAVAALASATCIWVHGPRFQPHLRTKKIHVSPCNDAHDELRNHVKYETDKPLHSSAESRNPEMEDNALKLSISVLGGLPARRRLVLKSASVAKPSRAETFQNPVLYEDYPDNDISVGPDGAFNFSASNFHYSPGAPILRSLDLVNWEPVGHSIPRLTFGDGYDLPPGGPRAYRGGTWASTLSGQVNVSQLNSLEGNRMYKINGTYYILNDQPGSTTYIWKSSSPWGPYEPKVLVQNIGPPIEGSNSPHQGRMPVLAPVTWGADGFPEFAKGSNGGWGSTYPLPLPSQPPYSWTRTYNFESELGPTWEWNHNPDVTSFEVSNGVTLRTASVTDDIYSARNTLTHRIHGEFPKGTVEIDFSNAADGDRTSPSTSIPGTPVGPGQEVASAPVPSGAAKLWFRAELDARASGTRAANFFYSFDGVEFAQLGPTHELYTGWAFFVAYRFRIFNFATKALGVMQGVFTFKAISGMVISVSHKIFQDRLVAAWRDESAWDSFKDKHSVISDIIESTVMDVFEDMNEYAINPWYHPVASFKQVMKPLAGFFWEVFGRSPVFWLVFAVWVIRWASSNYDYYYGYLAEAGSTASSWWTRGYRVSLNGNAPDENAPALNGKA
ncbi:hypothetical protein INS49_003055 [Diaporthe citri]|uniref:uncharacterized protein n=1 Tax=Diaporthe citri TaxID=83186 RepID=UPI001C7E8BB7|nr:uncharacterized protein INS49_003055 [Diaporthe citri]KAG6368839.1 hypothetical protein INS49_003055 [Diaporthe citri]